MIKNNSNTHQVQGNRPPQDGGSRPPGPLQNPSTLNILSVNCQGLNDNDKIDQILTQSTQYKLNILLLQETKLTTNNHHTKHLSYKWKGETNLSCAGNASKGVATLTKVHISETTSCNHGRFIVSKIPFHERTLILVNVYAPNSHGEQQLFFNALNDSVSEIFNPDDILLLIGDFNCVLDNSLDRISNAVSNALIPSNLVTLIDCFDLFDVFRELNPSSREMSWSNSSSASRIDKAYISACHLHLVRNCSYEAFPYSDHKALFLSLGTQSPIPKNENPQEDTFHTSIFKSEEFIEFVCKNKSAFRIETLPQDIKLAAKLTFKETKTRQDSYREELLRLKKLEKDLANYADISLLPSIKESKKLFYKLSINKFRKHRDEQDLLFFKDASKCSKLLSKLIKPAIKTCMISSLKDSNGISRSDTIPEIASEYYERLYTYKPHSAEHCNLLFENVHARVSSSDVISLDSPITIEEVELALTVFPHDKAPGADGITAEGLSHFLFLKQDIANMYNSWMDGVEIPQEISSGVITLIFKKGDPTDIANYRPITLLNSLYKTFTRILASRLKHVLPSIIGPEQTAIPTRYIGNNVRLMSDILCYSKVTEKNLLILTTDLEKAFDKISHNYLFNALNHFGFGNRFVNTIRSLYLGSTAKIKANNILSESLNLNSGVRQGDPLSPMLFVLGIEPLIRAISDDPQIKGFSLPDGSKAKISGYADDLAMFLESVDDVDRIQHWMEIYEEASCSKFNRNKCEIVSKVSLAPTDYFQKISNDPAYSFKYLGVSFSLDLNFNPSWESLIKKMELMCKIYGKANLTIAGKVAIINSYLLPLFTYQASFVETTQTHILAINNLTRKFLWNNSKAKVNWNTVCLPIEDGGLGVMDIESSFGSLKAKWISRLLSEERLPWKPLANFFLKNINADYGHGLSCLFCPGSIRDSKRALSPFWSQATLHFWQLKPFIPLNSVENPGSIIRCLPLFNNPLILLNGKPLTGERWKALARAGICRVADVIFDNKLGTKDEITNLYGRVFNNNTYNDLCKAIPDSLLNAIQEHPWTFGSDSLWAYNDDKGTFTAFTPDGDDSPIPEGLRSKLRPYKVTENGPVFLDTLELPVQLRVGPRDAVSLRSSEIRHLLSRDSHSSTPLSKSSAYWTHLGIEPPVSWKSTFKSHWKAPVPAKYKDICWLVSSNSLFTGETARKCNSNAIPHNCACGQPETMEHMFLKCDLATTIWDLVSSKWMTATQSTSAPSPSLSTLAFAGSDLPSDSPRWHKSLWQILSMTAIASIWKGRCQNVYGDTCTNYIGKFIIGIRRATKLSSKILPSLRGLQLI